MRNIVKLTFCTVFKLFDNDSFLKPFERKPRIHSTGLKTGCKPVLFVNPAWAGSLMHYQKHFTKRRDEMPRVRDSVVPIICLCFSYYLITANGWFGSIDIYGQFDKCKLCKLVEQLWRKCYYGQFDKCKLGKMVERWRKDSDGPSWCGQEKERIVTCLKPTHLGT